MTIDRAASSRNLRLWPGVVAAVLQWFIWLGIPAIIPQWGGGAVLGGLFMGLVIVVWWLFFSRAPGAERLGALVLIAAAVAATPRVVHESIADGMMGFMPFIYAIPAVTLALVAWAVFSRRLRGGLRYASLVVFVLAACGVLALIRTDGLDGNADSDFHWRWTPTAEQRLLARTAGEPVAVAPPAAPAPGTDPEPEDPAAMTSDAPTKPGTERDPASAVDASAKRAENIASPKVADPARTAATAEWPGFRGSARDGVVQGLRIATDWSASPPVELWRRPIGPGWSSFAVRGDLLYTQEQRGDEEIVASYRVSSGQPVWKHRDGVRFWESNGGAGPRATPTLSGNRVYAFGATGILNALDARTGAVVWSRNAAADTGKTVPDWGFTSSPLVVSGVVIVHAGALAAYDSATGERRWVGPAKGGSYSSPHLVTIDGVQQVVMMSGAGAIGVAPADGTVLWEHAWPAARIVQPAVTPDGDLLLNASDTSGLATRRVTVARGAGGGWTVDERWTSRGLKPYFNDLVVHEGHAYGFDGSILACIDLQDGERKWKGGRFGHGQLVLLPGQDLLLVVSEDGELALVKAAPDTFTEVTRFQALDGKTWNHPVIVGDVLLVRNGEEMAAFRLPLGGVEP